MAEIELIMPKMGESIMEATILKWLKKEGETVDSDESVLEIATDKVDSEVPSPVEGTISKILFQEGDVVAVGKPIAIINTNGEATAPAPSAPQQEAKPAPQPEQKATQPTAEAASPSEKEPEKFSTNRFYSPLVLNIAKEEGISMSELEKVPGTGKDDRVTKKDILEYVKNRKEPTTQQQAEYTQPSTIKSPAPVSQPEPKYNHGDNVEIVEMDRMRRLIADHMVRSKHTSPHVTSFVEADVTNLVMWRERIKDQFQKREGEKITFTPIFIEAIVRALKDFPFVNSSVDGYNVIRKKDINIGMATALPNGNLIVPVIKNADRMNLVGITKAVNDLAGRARQNKLKPDEIEGGTFTITNVGTFGNVMGTPVINQPQVAIIATGAIKKKPVVLETPQGDVIAIRHMMFLSHSYDHRIVDGAMGGAFVRKVADYLEAFDPERDF